VLVATDDAGPPWRGGATRWAERRPGYGADGVVTGVALLWRGARRLTGRGSDPASLVLFAGTRRVYEAERLVVAGVAHEGLPEQMPWGLIEWRITSPEGVELVLVQIPDGHPLRSRLHTA
jgi:hypothetical protein